MKCLCATTRRLARLLTQQYEEGLRPSNLTPAQFEVTSTLVHRPGMSQAKLARSLALDQTTLSRNLNLLIARGWIARQAGAEDRRQATYAVTSEGRRAWSEALPLWQTVHERMQERLGAEWGRTWSALDLLSEVVVPAD